MDIREALRSIWRRKYLVALIVALGASAAIGFSTRTTPVYAASAKVFIGTRAMEDPNDDLTSALQELTFSSEFLASYAEVLKSRPLAERVIADTNVTASPQDLTRRIDTRILPRTRIIEVVVADTSPHRAQLLANRIVDVFVEERGTFGGGATVSASVFEQALRPQAPVRPRPMRDGVLGALVGMVLGVGVVLVLDQVDLTLRSKSDVERALGPIPVLAVIPVTEARGREMFLTADPNSPAAEAVRILRTALHLSSAEPVRRVLVTSPSAEEGKTTVATNLAASIAIAGHTTVLLESDLRRPVMREYFSYEPPAGLSEVLDGQVPLDGVIRKTEIPSLSVITAGEIPPNPSELLGSEAVVRVLDELQGVAEITVLDTPPALPVADALVLAPLVDSVIIVLRAGRTTKGAAREVVAAFHRASIDVLGVVLNAVEPRDADDYYGYQYYSSRSKPGDARQGRRKEGAVTGGSTPQPITPRRSGPSNGQTDAVVGTLREFVEVSEVSAEDSTQTDVAPAPPMGEGRHTRTEGKRPPAGLSRPPSPDSIRDAVRRSVEMGFAPEPPANQQAHAPPALELEELPRREWPREWFDSSDESHLPSIDPSR